MIRVAWIADYPSYRGGAEYTAADFRAAAPPEVQVLSAAPGDVPRADVFVVHNCTEYTADLLPSIAGRPVLKYVHDLWPVGDLALKLWFLEHANLLVFTSPLHVESFRPHPSAKTAIIPPFVDIPRFREELPPADQRTGTCWVGRIHPSKGLTRVEKWARENGEVVDVYGQGQYFIPKSDHLRPAGMIEPNSLPMVLRGYRRFVHLPLALEPFGRSVAEAWAAGCELVVNQKIGSLHFCEQDPESLVSARDDFWECVLALA